MKKFKDSAKVLALIKLIPKGKVTTYGAIGAMLNINPRIVGRILHWNPDPRKFPCHRVVNRIGRVAQSYGFGGAAVQVEKLQKEKVLVVKNKVDLKRFYWHPIHK